ncbi:uncharacterized protein TNCV_3826401 [Trichonephila clavipes]|nr:uncharacterized protein TNCV_3826401 [Trichonephila clavipes]
MTLKSAARETLHFPEKGLEGALKKVRRWEQRSSGNELRNSELQSSEKDYNHASILLSMLYTGFGCEMYGRGSLVVKVSDHGWLVTSSCPVPLKTRRVGQRFTLNLSRVETSSRWCCVVVRRGGASSGVVHITLLWFKITWSVAKSPRVAELDEAHFWLNGYVNKQNCRIWSEANPQVYVETPLHPEKLTVWCALWAARIIGPYFFKNDEGHNVTVNGDSHDY